MPATSTMTNASGQGGDAEDLGEDQEDQQRDERRQHEHVAVGEIDHADDAVDHRVADGDEPIDRSERQPVDQLLQEIVHASTRPLVLRPHAGTAPTSVGRPVVVCRARGAPEIAVKPGSARQMRVAATLATARPPRNRRNSPFLSTAPSANSTLVGPYERSLALPAKPRRDGISLARRDVQLPPRSSPRSRIVRFISRSIMIAPRLRNIQRNYRPGTAGSAIGCCKMRRFSA